MGLEGCEGMLEDITHNPHEHYFPTSGAGGPSTLSILPTTQLEQSKTSHFYLEALHFCP